jgi:trypsin
MYLLLVFALFLTACNALKPWYEPCGISKYADAGDFPLPERRLIVGGIPARPNEFPWQISMRTWSNFHYCGGSIINEQWVLTAAHCVEGDIPAQVQIVAGDHTRNEINSARQVFTVDGLFMHPDYDDRELTGDAALVKLSTRIEFNDNVQPVCAPEPANDYVYYLSQCSGWGTLFSGGPCCPETLQYVTLNVTTNAFCAAAYPGETITDDMICASDNNGGRERDSCQGDSGGPLTIKSSDGKFSLIGIVSWGYGCASGWPGVYGRVTEFLDWIEQTIDNNP